MNRRCAVRCLLTGAGTMLTSISSRAQEQDAAFKSDVFLVLLDVGVKDKHGRFVPGLTKENFTVIEDGRRQTITVFDAEDRPVTMGILLDESRSMTPKQHQVVQAARVLIEASNPRDEIFTVHFNERVAFGLPPDTPFSNDVNRLVASIKRAVPAGKTALYDGLCEGLSHLRLGRRDKKTLVLISDGGDTASRRSRNETMNAVERSAATVYAVGLYDPENPEQDPRFLRRVASVSGGELYLPKTSPEIVDACRGIAREIRTRYTLGYIPSASAKPDSFRTIEVQARDARGKLNTRTRRGYRYGGA